MSCGAQENETSPCPAQESELPDQHFETLQDSPGPVRNFSVRSLNPYSVQLHWARPARPNGLLSHYVVRVVPEARPQHNWTVSVPAAGGSGGPGEAGLSAVVDSLVGGADYRFDVYAVNGAGPGAPLEPAQQPNLTMPILGEFV